MSKLVSILFHSFLVCQVEDEVIGSECELQDISVTPLLNALDTHKTVAVIDLSHNFLGNDSWLLIVTSIWICFWITKGMLTVSLHASQKKSVIASLSLLSLKGMRGRQFSALLILAVHWLLSLREWNNGETSTISHIRAKIR
jgi:hypothetical protein